METEYKTTSHDLPLLLHRYVTLSNPNYFGIVRTKLHITINFISSPQDGFSLMEMRVVPTNNLVGLALTLAKQIGASVICGHTHKQGIQHEHTGFGGQIRHKLYGGSWPSHGLIASALSRTNWC